MSKAIKKCPFCGGEASLGTVKYSPCDITELNNREKGYFVNCQICSARNENGISYATKEEAIKHWNTRQALAELAKQEQENERLKELLKYAYELPMNEAGDYDENVAWMKSCEQALKEGKK